MKLSNALVASISIFSSSLSSSSALRGAHKQKGRKALQQEYIPYDVRYTSSVACPFGSVSAEVKDDQGNPVVGKGVSFLLVGEQQGNEPHHYSGQVRTDENGVATFDFESITLDGSSLWCSMAIDNPTYMGLSQTVPCSVNVCDEETPIVEPPIVDPPIVEPPIVETYKPYEVEYASINACPYGSVTAEVKDDQGNPIVGKGVSFLLVGEQGIESHHYSGNVQTDESGVATFDFEAAALDGSSLWCSMAIDNPSDMGPTQNVPCSVNVCDEEPPIVETYKPYDVKYTSTNACPHGSVSAEVKDDQGNPIVGKDVSFLLIGEQGIEAHHYSGNVQTDDTGVATFDFEANTLDGSSLWCSMAIDNPNDMSPTQLVPCSVNICDEEPPIIETYKPYDVKYTSTNACPHGSVTAEVRDDQGNPIVGKDVSFLLVGEQGIESHHYSGNVQTDENGVATFDFEADTLDGSSLWCSMAIDNPNDMSPTQNVPCSVNVCDDEPPSRTEPTTLPYITELILFDADADLPIGELVDGEVIVLTDVGRSLGVLAVPSSGSIPKVVQFEFDGREELRTERVFPFALGGNTDDDLFPVEALSQVGKHTISATAFSESGEAGPTFKVTFFVEP